MGAVALVIGVGPGLGSAVARRFAREGCAVALVARSEERLRPVQEAIVAAGGTALSVPCDATDPDATARAVEQVRASLGPPEVLVYNAGAFVRGEVADLDPDGFEQAWRANCFGAFLAARLVVPEMRRLGRGTILLTGATASLRGGAGFSALAVGKFGLRALAQSLARENGAHGIHVAHVVVDGQIDLERTRRALPDRPAESFLSPDALADVYWSLHRQDRTTWTHEIDVRPAGEKF